MPTVNPQATDQNMPGAISLFAGAGGCSLGFKKADYRILYALDIDQAAVETYQSNFPNTICHQGDIRDCDFGKLLDELGLNTGDLDILIGGPPCQGFSTAGTRFWDDPRNTLLKSYVKALDTIRPKWFIMENVEGLLTTKNGEYVFEAAKAFIELGYRIRIDKVYAHEYGIPQRRKRVLIIGNNIGCDFDLPRPKVKAHGSIFRNSDITLQHAINGLPKPAIDKGQIVNYETDLEDEWETTIRNETGEVSDHFSPLINGVQLRRIHALKPGQTMKDLPVELQHTSFIRRANRRVRDGTPTEKRGGAPSGLKRLYFDEPCLTITSAAPREFIHPVEDRPLTVRECARIQTFPDSFAFSGSVSQKIQQIGNAIPPMLAQVFAEHIKADYGFEPTDEVGSGQLIGFTLTKASAMSPALKKTELLIEQLMKLETKPQLSLFG